MANPTRITRAAFAPTVAVVKKADIDYPFFVSRLDIFKGRKFGGHETWRVYGRRFDAATGEIADTEFLMLFTGNPVRDTQFGTLKKLLTETPGAMAGPFVLESVDFGGEHDMWEFADYIEEESGNPPNMDE